MTVQNPTDQPRTSTQDIAPGSPAFVALQGRVAELMTQVVPHGRDMLPDQVYAALRQRGVDISRPVFEEIIRSADPTPDGRSTIGGVWIVTQIDGQDRVRHVFRR